GQAERSRLPVRADDQHRAGLGHGLRPGEQLGDPVRVVEDRRRAVAQIERGHDAVLGCPALLALAGWRGLAEELVVRLARLLWSHPAAHSRDNRLPSSEEAP